MPPEPRCSCRSVLLRMPASGLYTSRHMMPTTTSGIAQGTSASVRASQRSRRFWLSSSARPSDSASWSAVTDTAHTRPIRKESQKRASSLRSRKLARPVKEVVRVTPDCASVKASASPYSSGPTLSTRTGISAGSSRNQASLSKPSIRRRAAVVRGGGVPAPRPAPRPGPRRPSGAAAPAGVVMGVPSLVRQLGGGRARFGPGARSRSRWLAQGCAEVSRAVKSTCTPGRSCRPGR